jgi:hypothetical protein
VHVPIGMISNYNTQLRKFWLVLVKYGTTRCYCAMVVLVHFLTIFLLQHIPVHSFLLMLFIVSSAKKSIGITFNEKDDNDPVVQCNHLQLGFTLPCAKAWAWDEVNTKNHVSITFCNRLSQLCISSLSLSLSLSLSFLPLNIFLFLSRLSPPS